MPVKDGPDSPLIGQHMATLNLFQEADGSFWLTVASAPAAVREAARRMNANPGEPPLTPMAVLAEWLEPAVMNFLASWRGQRSAQPPKPTPGHSS
jgi:hypothetical protein